MDPEQEDKPKRGRPAGSKAIPTDDIIRVLAATGGNFQEAADVLGCQYTTIKQRVDRDPRLKALYEPKAGTSSVGGVEAMTRGRTGSAGPLIPEPEEGDAVLAEVVQIQDEELMIQGLGKVGISEEMLEKLRNISAIGPSAGRFMASSLALTHKLMIVQTIELKEESDHIRKHYLRNENLSPEERSYWQKCFNEIADLIGKGFDRTLTGTQALVAMQRAGSGGVKKMKQGPQPLNEKPATISI